MLYERRFLSEIFLSYPFTNFSINEMLLPTFWADYVPRLVASWIIMRGTAISDFSQWSSTRTFWNRRIEVSKMSGDHHEDKTKKHYRIENAIFYSNVFKTNYFERHQK